MKPRTLIAVGTLAAAAGWALSAFSRRGFSFSGKVFLITGGSRGLGLLLARQICAEGGRVALLARDAQELAKARQELVRSFRADVLTIPCDLLERGEAEEAVRTVVSHFGRVDVLINNAGIIEIGPINNMKREDFEQAMDLHFWAAYTLITNVIPHFRRRGGGRIVNISSVGGRMAVPHLAPYCASKFALVGLSEALSAELARENIHVTTVTPGLMRTGSHIHAKFKGDHSAEYTWFATAATLPVFSMKAERAAARILTACKRGDPTLTMPLPTRVALLGNALFPNLSGAVLKLVNAFLPPAADGGDNKELSGKASQVVAPASNGVEAGSPRRNGESRRRKRK